MANRLLHGHNRAATAGVSPTYQSWKSMKARCDCPGNIGYQLYGGRGITYDSNWSNFINFLNDMGNRPNNTNLERRKSDENYCKSNCKWATFTEQNRNRRPPKHNTTGIAGVNYEINRWRAFIGVNNKKIALGNFKDFFEACCARKSAENSLW